MVVFLSSFNLFGIAEGTVDKKFGMIKEMRLRVHSDSENWIILSEVTNEYITLDWLVTFSFILRF